MMSDREALLRVVRPQRVVEMCEYCALRFPAIPLWQKHCHQA
jgi:hypothetical protein